MSPAINEEFKRIKRQLLNKDKNSGILLKSKLLANLNKYSLNNQKDMLAPISSISSEKEMILSSTTTNVPFLNLFQPFPTSIPIQNFSNMFKNNLNLTLPHLSQSFKLFPTYPQQIFESSTIFPNLTLLQSITLLPSPSFTLSEFNQQQSQNFFSQIKSSNILLNKINEQSDFKLPLFKSDYYPNSLNFLYDDYKTTTGKNVIDSNATHKNNLISSENKSKSFTNKEQPKYINRIDFLQNKTTDLKLAQSLPHTLYVNHINPNTLFFSNKNYNTKNKLATLTNHPTSYENLDEKDNLPHNIYERKNLTKMSSKKTNYDSIINRVQKHANDLKDETKTPIEPKKFQNKIYSIEPITSQISIREQQDYIDNHNEIQTVPKTITDLKLPSFIRNQREYSKHRNLGVTQTSLLPILNFPYQTFGNIPQAQNPNIKSIDDLLFNTQQLQQKQLPNKIQLLSEYAITTTISPFYFATTLLNNKQINTANEYLQELNGISDDYNPGDLNLSNNEKAKSHGNLLRPISFPRETENCIKVPPIQKPSHGSILGIEENMEICNSQRLSSIIKELIIPGDAEASKRVIQQRVEAQFNTFYNVICGTGFFSYIAHTDEFCLASLNNLNCYVFSPICSVRLGLAPGIAQTKRVFKRHYN